jgi:hypothetical protein
MISLSLLVEVTQSGGVLGYDNFSLLVVVTQKGGVWN